MRGEVKWYDAGVGNYRFASSPKKEKINRLKQRVEEFHKDSETFTEFIGIFNKGQELNNQLKDILNELEVIWTEVNNNVPLSGWCEAGVKAEYEKKLQT